jgi:hemerythrin-like domain-containing protein
VVDASMRPRQLEIPSLLDTLVKEHEEVRTLLKDLSALISDNKFLVAADRIKAFKPYIDQHVIDEEAKVLKILLDAYGREKSARAIAVFQEHREIHQLIRELQESIYISSDKSREVRDALEDLMRRHFKAEESWIFPWVLETYRKTTV